MAAEAEIVLKASDRELDRNLDNAGKKLRGRMSKLGKEFAGAIGNGLKTGLDLVGLGGVGSIVAAGRGVANFQRDLVRLQISSGKTKREILDLERQLFAVGKAKGVDPDELLAGAAKYTSATGDLQTYVDGLEGLGETATATGASVDDLSNVAQALTKNLGVGGKQWGDAFDVLAAQGKSGAVELNEMARILTGLTPQFAQFGTVGIDGVRELGATLQIVKGGFNTAEEAATGLRAIMTNLLQNQKKFKDAKVKVFEDDGKTLRPLADIVEDIGKSPVFTGKGGASRLVTAFGSSEAYRAVLPLLKAGRAEFDKLAQIDAKGTIAKDFATFMDSPAGKMQSASAAIKEAFNESLKDNIAGVAKAMQKVADLIAWIGNHPYLAAALYAGARGGSALLSAFAGGGAGGGGLANALGGIGGAQGGASPGGRAAKLAGGVAGVGTAFAAGYAIGTAFDQATGASHKLATAMLRFTGKLNEAYEAKMARGADLGRRINSRGERLKFERESGQVGATGATQYQANLLGLIDQHIDELEALTDQRRARLEAKSKRKGSDVRRKVPLLEAFDSEGLTDVIIENKKAEIARLKAKAKAAPVLAEDLLGFASQVDPRLAGITGTDEAAGPASKAAIKLLSDQPGAQDPTTIANMLIDELRKAAGLTGGKIAVEVSIDDGGRLVGEVLEDSPHQRRH